MDNEQTVRQALHDLTMTYVTGADRGDAAVMRSAFHPDGRMDTGLADAAIDVYAETMVGRTRSAFRTMFHSITNERYEIAGDRARGECYVSAYALTAGDDAQEIMAGGRYLDRFDRRDGVWKISHRLYVQDWRTSRPAPMPPAPGGMARGGFFPDDPAHAFWACPIDAAED